MEVHLLVAALFLGTYHVAECLDSNYCISPGGFVNMGLNCGRDEMIHVHQAFFGLAQPGTMDCGQPDYTPGDCYDFRTETTEEFRMKCNGFSNCNRHVTYPASDIYCMESFEGEQVYVRAQYECIERRGPHGHQIGTLFPLRDSFQSHTGVQVQLRTQDYPSGMEMGQRSTCRAQVHPSTMRVRLDILDLSTVLEMHPDKEFCLHMGNQATQCTSPGDAFSIELLEPEEDGTIWLWFWSSSPEEIPVRFWIVLSLLNGEGGYGYPAQMNVTCGDSALLTEYVTVPTPVPDLEKLDKDNDITMIIVGGAIAGTIVVILLIVILAMACKRKRPLIKDDNYDYICHANVAIATKLGAQQKQLDGLGGTYAGDFMYGYAEDIKPMQQGPTELYAEFPEQDNSTISPYGTSNDLPWPAPPEETTYDTEVLPYDPPYQNQVPALCYTNEGYLENSGERRQPAWQANATSAEEIGQNDKHKSQLIEDLERLYAKPMKRRSDETAIVENDIYRRY